MPIPSVTSNLFPTKNKGTINPRIAAQAKEIEKARQLYGPSIIDSLLVGVDQGLYQGKADIPGMAGSLISAPFRVGKDLFTGGMSEAGKYGPTIGEVGSEVVQGAKSFGSGLLGLQSPEDTTGELPGLFEDRTVPSEAEALYKQEQEARDMMEAEQAKAAQIQEAISANEQGERWMLDEATKDEITQKAENEIVAQGGDKGIMERLGGEFDLLTMGLSLMASNDGKRSVGQNLGNAIMQARNAKISQAAGARKIKQENADLANTSASTKKLNAEADDLLKGSDLDFSDFKVNETMLKSATNTIATLTNRKADDPATIAVGSKYANALQKSRALAYAQHGDNYSRVKETDIIKTALKLADLPLSVIKQLEKGLLTSPDADAVAAITGR